MKMTLKVTSLVCAGVVGLSLFAAKAPEKAEVKAAVAPKAAPAAAQTVDIWASLPDVVAEVNGVPVKKAVVVDVFMKQFPNGKVPPMFTVDMVRQMAPQMVRSVVVSKLVEKEMEKAGFKASEEAARKYLNEQIKTAPKAQLEMINQQLALQGKSLKQYIDEMAKNPEVQRGIAEREFTQQTFVKNIKISDAEAKKFYDANPEMFKTQADPADTVRASHILVKVDEKADAGAKKAALDKINRIRAEVLKDPSKFAEVAERESDCPSKKNGGSLGRFGKGQMVPEFEAAAFKLAPGKVSDVVTTQFGYHIILREPSAVAQVIPFEQMKENIVDYLTGQQVMVAQQKYAEQLEKAAKVKYFVKEAPAMNIAPAPAAAK